jgi:ferritin
MMNQTLDDAINDQVNAELSASYTYLAMSAFCELRSFRGAAKWLRLQSQEEYGHAMRLLDFLLARNCTIKLKGIEHPDTNFRNITEVFERAYEQEQQVSRQIDALYELAFTEKAFAELVELQWFLTEQVQEEKSAREIVGRLQMVKDDPSALLDIDMELGNRTTAAGT